MRYALELDKHELAILIAFVTRVLDAGKNRPELLMAEDRDALDAAGRLLVRLTTLAVVGGDA